MQMQKYLPKIYGMRMQNVTEHLTISVQNRTIKQQAVLLIMKWNAGISACLMLSAQKKPGISVRKFPV